VQFVNWNRKPCDARVGVSVRTTFMMGFGMINFQNFGQHVLLCYDCNK
jgi:hypothetical protein